MLLEVQQVAIKTESFEFAVSGQQQRASGSFIAAARFNADKAILDQVDASHRVASADFVQQFDQRYRIKNLSTHRNGHAVFESDFDLLFFIGSLLRRLRHLPSAREWRVAGVFQLSAFVAQVPEIAIAAVNFLAARSHRNAALFRIVEAIFTRLQIPFAPRRDHFQLGSQRLISHLEAHLVVALSGATMADGRCAFAQCDFNLMFRNHRTRERGAEQVFILINRARFQRRPDIASQKLLAQIFDHDLAGSGFIGLVNHRFDVISLAHVGDHGDHFIGIVFLEPWNDDGGIKPARVGENNFFRHARSCLGPQPDSCPRRCPAAIPV